MHKDLNKVLMKYLGTKYKFNGETPEEGLDCINLCCLVAKDLGYFLPNINHKFNTEKDYSPLFNTKDNKGLWEKVEPSINTLAVFTINGVVKHVGYMLSKDDFVHIMEGSKVTVDSISSVQWSRRLVGCYKYIGQVTEI